MICPSCARGWYDECGHEPVVKIESIPEPEDIDDRPVGVERRERTNKSDAALKDQQSTGRKRAAKLYPLDFNGQCEWQGKPDQGGGANPIEGCAKGLQQARHHGPDKNTLNNEPGNVHRICHSCHNRWHAANDPDYVWGQNVKD